MGPTESWIFATVVTALIFPFIWEAAVWFLRTWARLVKKQWRWFLSLDTKVDEQERGS